MQQPDQQPAAPRSADPKVDPPAESLGLNLLSNMLIPSVVLFKLSGSDYLGVKLAIVVALAFPILYGIRDYVIRGKLNWFSVLGVFSVTLTGGFSLMELDASYIAIKEASIPALFGVATLASLKTSKPLIRTFVLNDMVFETHKISAALDNNGRTEEFDRLLANGSWILAAGFLLSSVLNYGLAITILTADPGTVMFNEQLGTMNFLSYPVIMLPITCILMGNVYYLVRGIIRITEIPMEQLLKTKEAQ